MILRTLLQNKTFEKCFKKLQSPDSGFTCSQSDKQMNYTSKREEPNPKLNLVLNIIKRKNDLFDSTSSLNVLFNVDFVQFIYTQLR